MERNLTVILCYALAFLATFSVGIAISRHQSISQHPFTDTVTLTYKLTEFEKGAPFWESQVRYVINRRGEWSAIQTLPNGKIESHCGRVDFGNVNLQFGKEDHYLGRRAVVLINGRDEAWIDLESGIPVPLKTIRWEDDARTTPLIIQEATEIR